MITILKGDTSAAITITLATGYSYTDKSVRVIYQGVSRLFSDCTAGGNLSITFSADETRRMALGAYPVSVQILGTDGSVVSPVTGGVKIKVTDIPSEVYSNGVIAVDAKGMLYNVTDLPSHYTAADIYDKIREILSAGGATVTSAILAAILAPSLFAAGVFTNRLDAIYNDAPVVTNVSFEGLASESAVNAIAATKQDSLADYTTTNAVRNIVTNDVGNADWVTNITATSGGKDVTLLNVKWEDVEGTEQWLMYLRVPGIGDAWRACESPNNTDYNATTLMASEYHELVTTRGYRNALGLAYYRELTNIVTKATNAMEAADTSRQIVRGEQIRGEDYWYINVKHARKSNETEYDDEGNFIRTTYARKDEVPTAYTNAVKDVVTDGIASISNTVSFWEGYWQGDRVRLSVTNYYGNTSGDLPRLRIEESITNGSGEVTGWQSVWDENGKYTNLLATVADDIDTATNACRIACYTSLTNETATRAPLAWQSVTSAGHSNEVANSVYMTAPNTVFAGGLEWERVAVGEGSCCLLKTCGAPSYTVGDEGTFKFQDLGGTNYFGFAKTDSFMIGYAAKSINVANSTVTLTFEITSSGYPCVWWKADLATTNDWEQLNLPDGSAISGASYAVTWNQSPSQGEQECYLNVGSAAQGFFKFTYEQAGEAKFITNMKADLSGGILATNVTASGYTTIEPYVESGTVKWRVKQ